MVGVDREAKRGLVVDWKMGWQVGRKAVRQHWQLHAGGLAVARAYGLESVEVQLVHVREGQAPWVARHVLDGFDLDMFAADLREVYVRALDMRTQADAGRIPSGLSAGDWCHYCPARDWCPVRTALIRAVTTTDEFDDLLRIRPLSLGQVPEAYRRIRAAKKLIAAIEGAIYAAAREQPVHLGTDDDGTEHWLGHIVDEGNEELDGKIVHAVLAELHGPDVAAAGVAYETSKAAVDRALKAIAKRGELAAMKREVLARVKEAGGVTRRQREGVREFERRGRRLT